MKNILLILLSLLFFSCGSHKKTVEKTQTTTKIDSLFEEIKTLKINDTLFVPIHQYMDRDSVLENRVNNEVEKILQKINTTKKSGKNSYSVAYNPKKKAVEVVVVMAEQKSTKIKIEKEVLKDKSVDVEKKNAFYDSVYFWIVVLLVFLWAFFILKTFNK